MSKKAKIIIICNAILCSILIVAIILVLDNGLYNRGIKIPKYDTITTLTNYYNLPMVDSVEYDNGDSERLYSVDDYSDLNVYYSNGTDLSSKLTTYLNIFSDEERFYFVELGTKNVNIRDKKVIYNKSISNFKKQANKVLDDLNKKYKVNKKITSKNIYAINVDNGEIVDGDYIEEFFNGDVQINVSFYNEKERYTVTVYNQGSYNFVISTVKLLNDGRYELTYNYDIVF